MTVTHDRRGSDALVAALKDLDGVTGKTGWFETSFELDGTPTAYVATIMEFGAIVHMDNAASILQGGVGHGGAVIIPPRPTLGPTVAKQSKAWVAFFGEGAKAVLAGRRTALEVMETLVLKAAGDAGRTIRELTEPPLAPSTIARKGSSKPLIESGTMLRDVTGIAERGNG